ncbi:MAG TPA: DUF1289 domain-containing protein [Xanthobacteraceae bacterium]
MQTHGCISSEPHPSMEASGGQGADCARPASLPRGRTARPAPRSRLSAKLSRRIRSAAIAFRPPGLILPVTPKRRLMADSASPCNKSCAVDPVSGLCIGCGRSLAEIAGWTGLRIDERARIAAQLPGRLAGLERTRPPRADAR